MAPAPQQTATSWERFPGSWPGADRMSELQPRQRLEEARHSIAAALDARDSPTSITPVHRQRLELRDLRVLLRGAGPSALAAAAILEARDEDVLWRPSAMTPRSPRSASPAHPRTAAAAPITAASPCCPAPYPS